MEEQTISVICLGPNENFQGSYKIFYWKKGQVVTRKHKIREIPIPSWVIQCVEALAVSDGRYLADGNEPLLVDQFSNENDFAAALHEGDTIWVAQDKDEKNYVNDDDNNSMDKDPDYPLGIDVDLTADRGKIIGVPPTETLVGLSGVAPP